MFSMWLGITPPKENMYSVELDLQKSKYIYKYMEQRLLLTVLLVDIAFREI